MFAKDLASRSAKLSSMAPEFLPTVTPSVLNDKLNVRKSVDEASFPDDHIENLVIVVRKPGMASPTQSKFPAPSPQSSAYGSDGYKAAGRLLGFEIPLFSATHEPRPSSAMCVLSAVFR
jgi:la-related protein 1